MALSAYALRSEAAVKQLVPVTGTGLNDLYESSINDASDMVEAAWGRHIVSRGALTEYHPKDVNWSLGHELYTNEWPIVSVTSVHEDADRVYGASTLLAVTTDYIVSKPAGKIIRVSSALPYSWESSWRAVKLVYLAGYQNVQGTIAGADAVPYGILQVFDELVRWMVRWRSQREAGLQSVSDATGSRTFTGPPMITEGMRATLSRAGAMPASLRGCTGERDS